MRAGHGGARDRQGLQREPEGLFTAVVPLSCIALESGGDWSRRWAVLPCTFLVCFFSQAFSSFSHERCVVVRVTMTTVKGGHGTKVEISRISCF